MTNNDNVRSPEYNAAVQDGCPRNVIDGDVGDHFFKKGALSNSPVACIYCGEKKPMARQDGARP